MELQQLSPAYREGGRELRSLARGGALSEISREAGARYIGPEGRGGGRDSRWLEGGRALPEIGCEAGARSIGPEGLPEISRGRKPPVGNVLRGSALEGRQRVCENFQSPVVRHQLAGEISAAPPGRVRNRARSGGLRPRLISGRARPPSNHRESLPPPRPSGLRDSVRSYPDDPGRLPFEFRISNLVLGPQFALFV